MHHQLLSGRFVNLRHLRPIELDLFFRFRAAAGSDRLFGGTFSAEEASRDLMDPCAFLPHCKTWLGLELSGLERVRAPHGLLGALIIDLALRIGVAKGLWTQEDAIANPQRILWAINERQELIDLTEPWRDPDFRKTTRQPSNKINLPLLQTTLSKVGWTLDLMPANTEPTITENLLSVEEVQLMDVSFRMLALASCVDSWKELERLLGPELRATTPWEGNDSPNRGLKRAFRLAHQFGFRGDRSKIILLGLDRRQRSFASQAWLAVAQELRWFEWCGLFVVLCDDATLPTHARTIAVSLLDLESNPEINEVWRSQDLFYKRMRCPSFERLPADLKADEATVAECLNLVRTWTWEMTEQPGICQICADIYRRWGLAFFTPDHRTTRFEFGQAEVPVRWLTLAELAP